MSRSEGVGSSGSVLSDNGRLPEGPADSASQYIQDEVAAAPVPTEADREPVADGAIPSLSRIEESIAKGFAEIIQTFRDKLAFDAFKETQITKLHDELQGYKSDLMSKITRPFVNGLIRLHEDIGRVVEAFEKRDRSALTPEQFFKAIRGFREDIELLLSQNGIETYTEPSEVFNPIRQKAITTIAVSEGCRTGNVAARLRPGFEQGAKIIQKESVAVYVAGSAQTAPEGDPSISVTKEGEGNER